MTWSSEVKRPNYRDGMYLGAQDFIAEQDYELDLRRRLCLSQHAWGVFEGLLLMEQPDPGTGKTNIFILPGLAIDGFGRPLLAFAPMPLDVGLFQGPEFQTDMWVKVWLLYKPIQTDPPRLGYEQCADPSLTTRTQETAVLAVGDQPGQHDSVRIAGQPVPDSSLPPDTSAGYGALPDDSELARWPVCLGQVHWNGVDGFVSSSDADRRRYRVLGGVIAANAYAPEGTWDLSSRLRDTTDPTKTAPVAATVHGSLTVEGLLKAKASLELDGGQVTFDDASGADHGRPVFVQRVDTATSSDLKFEIGQAAGGHDRLVVAAKGVERLVVQDSADAQVKSGLQVGGLLDLSSPPDIGHDRILLATPPNAAGGTGLGLENNGRTLFERSLDGINWYLNDTSGGTRAMGLDTWGLRVKGDAWVGDGTAAGHLLAGFLDSTDDLHINPVNGKNVLVGDQNGTATSLFVTGDVWVGRPPNRVRLNNPIDVQAGRRYSGGTMVGQAGQCINGTVQLQLTANLASVNHASLMVALADIHNIATAVDARWSIGPAAVSNINNQTVTFDIPWMVCDDGDIISYSWVAIFYP